MAQQTLVTIHVDLNTMGSPTDKQVDSLTNYVDAEMQKLVSKIERRFQGVTCPNYAKINVQEVPGLGTDSTP